jgi:catechol 2,3-dioxygenase-like lactoylglutathione lyase family enzyme
MIQAVHHVGIAVADLDEAIEFFTAILGIGPSHVEDVAYPHLAGITGYPEAHARMALLPLPGSRMVLELLEYVQPAPVRVDMETHNVGNTHVAFGVDDLDAEFERLRALSPDIVQFRSESPIQAEVGSLSGAKFLYVRGPGEITVEFCEIPAGVGSSS